MTREMTDDPRDEHGSVNYRIIETALNQLHGYDQHALSTVPSA